MTRAMKLSGIVQLLGLRKPAVQTYGHEVRTFDLPTDGRVQLACWQHPRESPKTVDQAEVDALRRFLKPGDVAVDIGAHTGDTAVPLAVAVGRAGAVLAFEPNPYVFEVLKANAALNPDRAPIHTYCTALGTERGRMTFEYSDAGFCNGGRHEGISVWKHGHAFSLEVDAVVFAPFVEERHPDLLARVRYVKLDTEGYDRFVLESMREFLAKQRPYVRSEVYGKLSREQRVAQVRVLTGLGYRLSRVVSDTQLEGEPVTEANVMNWKHFDLFCTPA